MKISPIPSNESERLLALRELNILDTAAEKNFDDITLLASQICDAPISYISLLDKDRQWFKSSKGLSITETNRDISFCSHAIHQSDIMIVPDVLKDDRFVDNPKVTGHPFIRFYAGVPLLTEGGFKVGTLCIADHNPRNINPQQIFALEVLARQVESNISLRAKISAQELAEEKYRSIIANMKLGLLEVDREEKILFANQSFIEMSGYTLNELLGKKSSDIFLQGESSRLMKNKNISRMKGRSDAYEIEIRDKKGEIRWWLISGAPRLDNSGDLTGSIGIHLDITNQKLLEIELIEAKELAEESTRSKETFLANMSHEIRTPMNAIIGMSTQLAKTNLDSTQQFYLETIHSASDNLLFIINDILDFSKIDAGKLQLERIGFGPKELLNSALRVLSHRAEEKGLSLNNVFFDPAISPVLMGDPYRLNQVLINLISNAIKFTEKGKVDISCDVLNDSLLSQTIQITVKDTGIGMEANFLDCLFEKFSQEDASVTRQHGGTGLGMSICKDLINLMGGEIHVKSKKGIGSTILLKIKFDKGTFENLPEKPIFEVDSKILVDKKVLLVDDNQMNRLVAATILANYGAIITTAQNGKEAVEILEKIPFNIVLMDIQMPVMDGVEATAIIRSKISKELPIIALTANAIKGDNDKYLAAGMNGYLSKPFIEKDLLNVVALWLNKIEGVRFAFSNTVSTDKLYDLTILQNVGRGDNEFVDKMISLFIAETPEKLIAMEESYRLHDFKAMGKIAHQIKPILDNLGIFSLKEPIRIIEKLGQQELNHSDIPLLLSSIRTTVSLVIDALQNEISALAN
jgi:two-component system, sensor histidine kinase